jgi:transposase
MLTLPPSVKIFVAAEPVDARKSYDGLSALVESHFGHDLLAGYLYAFINRRGHQIQLLFWDRNGICIVKKRLDKGQFAKLWTVGGGALSMTMSELSLFIEGSEYVGRRALSPAAITAEELAPAIVL